MDRIELHECRQRPGLGADKRPLVNRAVADAAVERRLDLGIGQVGARPVQRGLEAQHIGLRGGECRFGLVETGLSTCFAGHQLGLPVALDPGEVALRLHCAQCALGFAHGRLVEIILDDEQRLSLRDLRTGHEPDRLDHAGHARSKRHPPIGVEPPVEVRGLREGTRHCLDRDDSRGRGALL